MIHKPKFKNHFHVEIVDPDLVLLLFEDDCLVLKGPLYALLAPYLDGESTFDHIVEGLEGRATALDVYYGLSLLEKGGYIVEGDDTEMPGMAAFRDYLNVDSKVFRSRLDGTRVAVRSIGTIPLEPFVLVLESIGIRVSGNGDFRVVLSNDYLHPELQEFNRQALALNLPWMLVKPAGAVVWIGPIFNPRRTACWACLAKRLNEHRLLRTQADPRTEIKGGAFPLSKSLLPSASHLAMDFAATEVLKWIVQGESEAAEGRLITFDVKSATLQKHVLVRQENCPHCGKGRQNSRTDCEPWVLNRQPKVFTSDGGHRAVLPQVVFRKYEHHISPVTGIVDSLEASHPDDCGPVQVFEAGLSSAIRRNQRACWGRRFGSRTVGKGMTEIQAKTSALCEALERYSGVYQGDEATVKASYLAIGERAIHPNRCMNFSRKQYENRDEWNQRESEFNWIPQPFDEEREIEWTAVWSLTEKRSKFVPTAYCYYAYPASDENDFCRADSNGNAAGSTLEEAILQGFMELVERDAVALWWYNGLGRPAVDLEGFNQPYFRALRHYYEILQREIIVLDLTSDFPIPAFAAICKPIQPDRRDLFLGFGAHFDPAGRNSRALTEMNQFLPYALTGNLSPVFVNELPAKFPEACISGSPRCCGDFPRRWSEDLREDVMTCVTLARERNLEVLVQDQTRPDIGLRVVKVIVPGMRHFWARFGPGRLYDRACCHGLA